MTTAQLPCSCAGHDLCRIFAAALAARDGLGCSALCPCHQAQWHVLLAPRTRSVPASTRWAWPCLCEQAAHSGSVFKIQCKLYIFRLMRGAFHALCCESHELLPWCQLCGLQACREGVNAAVLEPQQLLQLGHLELQELRRNTGEGGRNTRMQGKVYSLRLFRTTPGWWCPCPRRLQPCLGGERHVLRHQTERVRSHPLGESCRRRRENRRLSGAHTLRAHVHCRQCWQRRGRNRSQMLCAVPPAAGGALPSCFADA